MAISMRAPDVYVEEISVFPPSVAEVETAIPAFIGYTEKTKAADGSDLVARPVKIYSLKDYEAIFGGPAVDLIAVTYATATGLMTVTPPTVTYLLYYSVKLFFDNGGGKCYITSAGGYTVPAVLDLQDFIDGLSAVALEDEPTLLVVPEAVRLTTGEYTTLVQAMLKQCGDLMDRFAIFDLHGGGEALTDATLATNRGFFGNNNLKYGAAYYPFLRTTLNYYVDAGETNVDVKVDAGADVDLIALKNSNTTAYNAIKQRLKDHFVVLPPSGAVAGAYAAVDNARGVWKAPANVSLADVIEPVIKLDNVKQGELNIDPNGGKSINALRAFSGKGVLVWGARTLAGNDNEWRYIPVRRFFNMVEESVKKSTHWAVFEPNDANTWVKVRGMIENFLNQKWREGALAGATIKEAFFVRCGLGTTMNSQDILEGRMIVDIGMAVVRPAEFILLRFSHKLQTS